MTQNTSLCARTFYDDEHRHANSNNISMEIINQLHGHMDFESISNYYDLVTYNDLIKTQQTHNFNIMHINSRSLTKNFDNMQLLLRSLHIQPDILAVTESWLTGNNKHLHQLTGYHSYHLTRNTRKQGGVSIFVFNLIHSQEIKDLTIVNEDIEISTIRIKTNSLGFLLCTIYRPNSKHIAVDEFSHILHELLREKAKNKKNSADWRF